MPSIQLRFDLRVPSISSTTYGAQYQACLDMAEWGERIGARAIVLSEHHGDPAGFTPAPLTIAAAVLGRTQRIPVMISAALAPLHDPVRLAEQMATIDCMAPGRLAVILGAGYRKAEFEMAGVDRSKRGKLLEECVEVLRRAWTGEPFEWRGRTVLVTPTPATPGGPRILLGGKSEAAGRRAARLRIPFAPSSADPAVLQSYWDECTAVGYEGSAQGIGGGPAAPGFVMVSEDPEATWREIGPLAMEDAETYASWQDDAVRSTWVVANLADLDELRASGRYVVVTPQECVALASRVESLTLHPLMGGISPHLAWESLRLFEEKVLPNLSA